MVTPGKTHKKVNSNSANRRQCARIDDNSAVHNNNLSNFQHENLTRITLKLSVPATDDPSACIIDIINQFSKQLFLVDDTAALIPWLNSDAKEGSIMHKSSPLKSIRDAKIYFTKLWNINPGKKEHYIPTCI